MCASDSSERSRVPLERISTTRGVTRWYMYDRYMIRGRMRCNTMRVVCMRRNGGRCGESGVGVQEGAGRMAGASTPGITEQREGDAGGNCGSAWYRNKGERPHKRGPTYSDGIIAHDRDIESKGETDQEGAAQCTTFCEEKCTSPGAGAVVRAAATTTIEQRTTGQTREETREDGGGWWGRGGRTTRETRVAGRGN